MRWDDLLDTRAPAEDSEIRDAVNHQLGVGVRRRDGLASPADVAALRDRDGDLTMARKITRPVARPAAAAGPAAGAVPQTRYYDPNVTWRSPDPAAEGDVPVPVSGAAEPAAASGVGDDSSKIIVNNDLGHRDWKMSPAGMVASERPAVAPGGEQAPAGGGQRGHDFVTSAGGPPLPADEATAAASRQRGRTGVTNSSVTVDARPGDRAHRLSDEQTLPVSEQDHDVGGQPGLSGASVSN
jgi:hypothetical protein